MKKESGRRIQDGKSAKDKPGTRNRQGLRKKILRISKKRILRTPVLQRRIRDYKKKIAGRNIVQKGIQERESGRYIQDGQSKRNKKKHKAKGIPREKITRKRIPRKEIRRKATPTMRIDWKGFRKKLFQRKDGPDRIPRE